MNWIKTSERLPEPGERILIFSNVTGTQMGYLSAHKIWKYSLDMRNVPFEITHWMPLPEPPKQ